MSTVGLSLGITPRLCGLSLLLLASLMYFGRVGVLSIAIAFAKAPAVVPVQYPSEKIMIG
jgi:trk system potassium uptake protein TrkH